MNGFNQSDDRVEPADNLTWLDYLIMTYPAGVMKVLASYGYVGYLAPADKDEMYEACLDLINKNGDQVIVDLLKSNPLYDVIADICTEETVIKVPYKSATGDDSFVAKIRTVNIAKLAENILLIVGIFFVADKFFNYLTKSE